MNYLILDEDEKEKIDYDAEYVLIFQEDIKDKKPEYEPLKNIDLKTNGLLSNLIKSEKITGKENTFNSFYLNNKRICIVGLGEEKSLTNRKIKSISGKIIKNAISEKDKKIFIMMRTNDLNHYSLAIEEAECASFSFIELFSEKKQKEKEVLLKEVFFSGKSESEMENIILKAKTVGESRNIARRLINYPSNYLNPEKLSEFIKEKLFNLEIEILNKKEIEKLKMGGLLGVNQGASDEPKFIIIRHKPKNKKNNIKIALVGKGITFDTGGISLKPSENMHEMKGDMAGAASVIALMNIVSNLQIPVEISALIPSTPNMPDGKALKPGDVITALNGKTVEVLNTDAEGRLILMDALSYAVKYEKPTHIIDIATLTGAISIALGDITTGLFTNNDDFAKKLIEAGKKTGEYIWQLPMFSEYSKQLESKIADLKNIGGRKAGSITAAKFLEEFVDNTPWIHLDIAGISYKDDHDYLTPSGTGEIISSITELLLSLSV